MIQKEAAMDTDFRPRIIFNADQKALREKMLRSVSDSAIKAVSFKMDGVLVQMPFSERGDMFMLMEKDFRDLTTVKGTFTEMRLAAEDAAASKYAAEGGASLEKIYDILAKMANLSPASRDKLIKRECELAVYFAMPRQFGKDLFRKAKTTKKKTIIVADTVYPRSVTVNILSRCGLETYDALIVPSESKIDISAPKPVYEAIIRKANTAPAKLLHIGSDVEADVETPILGGSKALLMSGAIPLMVKSGRLRGFVQARHVYDYDKPDFLALHCIFGIYAAYFFDTPLNKTPQTDFCGDEYMLGAIVGGALRASGCEPQNDLEKALMQALESNERALAGMEDMEKLFHAHFDGHLDKFGYNGCGLPIQFLALHAAAGDRAALQKYVDPAAAAEWAKRNSDPDIAPVYGRKIKPNAASKLADKLFPPGTKVRNIADGLLVKMKGKGKI